MRMNEKVLKKSAKMTTRCVILMKINIGTSTRFLDKSINDGSVSFETLISIY